MAYDPHLRLTWSGTLPNGEIWSNKVSLVPDNTEWASLANAVLRTSYLTSLLANVNLTDDLVADVSAYHSRAASRISPTCTLKRITLASIGEDGRYTRSPIEAAPTVNGGAGSGGMPHQIARKITLETDGDLNRVKGGWYIPAPSNFGFDYDTNLWSDTVTSEVRDSVKTFLDDLENAPNLDANSFLVVVASQGRRNKDGTVRHGPANWDVKRVNVGRRADVQRRRANKISEARITDATLANA